MTPGTPGLSEHWEVISSHLQPLSPVLQAWVCVWSVAELKAGPGAVRRGGGRPEVELTGSCPGPEVPKAFGGWWSAAQLAHLTCH